MVGLRSCWFGWGMGWRFDCALEFSFSFGGRILQRVMMGVVRERVEVRAMLRLIRLCRRETLRVSRWEMRMSAPVVRHMMLASLAKC